MSIKTRILTAGLLVAVFVVPAQGALLATQPVFVSSSQSIFCRAANVSERNQQITVEIVSSAGVILQSGSVTLVPGQTSASSRAGALSAAYCRFTTQGGRKSIRAGATVGNATTDLFAMPAS